MQNSNPTLLSAADLPSRRPATASSKPGALDGSIFDQSWPAASPYSASALFTDPFAAATLDRPFSESESDEDGELMEEPIDEQEIC
ncbi:hypothetical protein FQN49_008723, partial [Arthroderma sp. PD_2]